MYRIGNKRKVCKQCILALKNYPILEFLVKNQFSDSNEKDDITERKVGKSNATNNLQGVH